MSRSFRPYLTACVNLVGSGVISVSPLMPPPAFPAEPPGVQLAAVQLTAPGGEFNGFGYLNSGTADFGDGLTSRLAGFGKLLAAITGAVSALGGLRRLRSPSAPNPGA